ncbi:MAG: hypothetical protein U5K43_10140 [Halofilum sp. (in: g-proteobacteria)]|nr:hypothetical protein [Halofilum sp. (in: g-proteobacteria)]
MRTIRALRVVDALLVRAADDSVGHDGAAGVVCAHEGDDSSLIRWSRRPSAAGFVLVALGGDGEFIRLTPTAGRAPSA